MQFKWHPDEPPPRIEAHSKAKLSVLRSYLSAYFDRLNVNPSRENFRLDLVDGFSGCGTFRDGDGVLSGTPLIMLEEADAARERLNRKRIKPLHIDCKFYFVDVDAAHSDHLRRAVSERGYQVEGGDIVVRNSRFQDVAKEIVGEIRRRQPRAGRFDLSPRSDWILASRTLPRSTDFPGTSGGRGDIDVCCGCSHQSSRRDTKPSQGCRSARIDGCQDSGPDSVSRR